MTSRTEVLLLAEITHIDVHLFGLDLGVHATNSRRRPVLRQVLVDGEVVTGTRALQHVRLVDAREFLDLRQKLLWEVGSIVIPGAVDRKENVTT